ncbi:hypothetical protein [Geodermatophilus marinus]|uniref:hypothetical protein n=1 Tax=Geodermatophilus sp. LHW52908 TaxID=2303986 RepID=UPI0018F33F72|nr:hypothetical protein [Geodermatophilus sp. LHW52908]
MSSDTALPAGRRATPDADRVLFRRWVVATTAGEALGFLVPTLAVLAGADDPGDPRAYAALVAAGAGEGAVLGWAQGGVLARVRPGLPRRDWTLRTAAAAAVAWALGLAPAALGDAIGRWPGSVQVLAGLTAGLLLLASLGVAQWTVLRRVVPRSARWIGWTGAGWLAGLAVFAGLTTPLWQPGQAPAVVAAIGVAGGVAMAVTVAVVTGYGLVRLFRAAPEGAGHPGGAGGTGSRRAPG